MAAKKKAKKASAPAKKFSSKEEEILDGIRAECGEESAMLLGAEEMLIKIRGVIPTGCPQLDYAIGRGGIPLGRVTMIHGGEQSGKTTKVLEIARECQRKGGVVIYIDKEHKLDPEYAEKLGVDAKKFIIKQDGALEDVLEFMKGAIKVIAAVRERSGRRVPILVVLDSINAAKARAVIEGDVGDKHIAPEARVWSQNFPDIVETIAKEDVALVLVSQVRSKIGVMYGSNEDTAGGNAPRFYSSLIVHIKCVGSHKRDGAKVGALNEAECKKNQIAPPFKKAKYVLEWGVDDLEKYGVDWFHSLIFLAESKGVVKADGAWFSFDGERIGQGRDNAAKTLRGDHELAKRVVEALELNWDQAASMPDEAPEPEPDLESIETEGEETWGAVGAPDRAKPKTEPPPKKKAKKKAKKVRRRRVEE